MLTTRFKSTDHKWKTTWNKKKGKSILLVKLPGAGMAGKSVELENRQ